MKNKLSVVILLIFFLSLFNACNDKCPDNVLNRQEMEDFLVEMHRLEGSLRATGYYYGASGEREGYYDALFEKFNISRADYDSCLVWYTQHPKQFERIYNNVVVRLDTLGSLVRKGAIPGMNKVDEVLLWDKMPKYAFTTDSARNKLFFEVKNEYLLPQDFYELSFYHRLLPVDSSLNTHAVMYIKYKDGFMDSIYAKTRNDSVLRKYTLKLKARYNKKVESLSGYLLGCDVAKGKMGAVLDDIQLKRIYNPYVQDSIYKSLYKNEKEKNQVMIKKSLPDSIR